jgi:hypothetical protein
MAQTPQALAEFAVWKKTEAPAWYLGATEPRLQRFLRRTFPTEREVHFSIKSPCRKGPVPLSRDIGHCFAVQNRNAVQKNWPNAADEKRDYKRLQYRTRTRKVGYDAPSRHHDAFAAESWCCFKCG